MKCPECGNELCLTAEVSAHNDELVDMQLTCDDECGYSASFFVNQDQFVKDE